MLEREVIQFQILPVLEFLVCKLNRADRTATPSCFLVRLQPLSSLPPTQTFCSHQPIVMSKVKPKSLRSQQPQGILKSAHSSLWLGYGKGLTVIHTAVANLLGELLRYSSHLGALTGLPGDRCHVAPESSCCTSGMWRVCLGTAPGSCFQSQIPPKELLFCPLASSATYVVYCLGCLSPVTFQVT